MYVELNQQIAALLSAGEEEEVVELKAAAAAERRVLQTGVSAGGPTERSAGGAELPQHHARGKIHAHTHTHTHTHTVNA